VQYAPALFRHLEATVDANRNRMGQYLLRVTSGTIVCRAPHGFPLGNGFRAVPATEL